MREKGRELDFEIEHSNRKNTNIILTCEVSDEEQFKAAVKNNAKINERVRKEPLLLN